MLKKHRGISLVEVLVALFISGIVVAAVMSIFSNSLDTSRQMMGTAKLDQTLNSAMETIAQDVGRAGYYAVASTNAVNTSTNTTNPFFFGTDDITVTGSTCVTFSYQADTTNTTPVTANRFGYRLNGGAIQYRTSGTDCSSGTWLNLTDPNIITISAFTLTLNTTAIAPNISTNASITDSSSYRTLTVSITGNLVGNTAVTRTITRTIVIDNSKYTQY